MSIKVKVYNQSAAPVKDLDLSAKVFGLKANADLLHQAVITQQANERQVLAHTKDRSEVRGGGKKPWKQKGTGRARVGSTRNPVWRGGGIAFGPKPRDYSFKLPRKVRRLALKSALSSKVMDSNIIVVDGLTFDEPKTKLMIETLAKLNACAKTLVITGDGDINVYKSARNIPGVKSLKADYINVYDVLKYETLLMTRDAVARVEEVFA